LALWEVNWMKDEDKTKAELIKELKLLREDRKKGVFKNFTEHKSAEEALKESEEKYRNLIESANESIISVDLQGNLLTLNSRAVSHLGGLTENYTGKTLWDIFPKKIADERFKDHQKVIRSGKPFIKENYVPFKGKILCFLTSIQPIKNRLGDIYAVLILANDITDRKKIENALVESEEKYRTVFENTGTATIIVEEDTTISLVNSKFERLSGYSKEEIENKMKWTDIIVPEDLERMKKYHIARRKTGEKPPSEYEFHFVDKKGNIKNIFLKVGIIPGTKKDIASLIDITEQKQAEEVIQESENRFRELFDHMSSGVAVYEAKDNGKDFIIKNLNRAAEKMEKVKKEDIIGKSVLKAFPGVKDFGLFKVFQEVYKTGKLQHHPITFYQDQRITGWRENYVYKLPSGEIVAVYDDITERKQAEEKVEHLNLVLRAIRNVNQLIVKEKDPNRLIKGVCENLVKTRGYHNAWIVLLDEEGKHKTSAEAGLGKDFLPMIELLKSGKLTTCSRKALKQQEVVITRDPIFSCPECPLSQKYSGRAGFAMRLEHSEKVCGLMSVSTPAHLAVDQEEQGLFEEVAGDVAFALYNIELDKERKQAEEKYRKLIKATSEGFWLLNSKKLTIEVNQSLCDMLGYTRNEMIGKTPMEFVDAENKKIFKEQTSQITNTTHRAYEISLKKKDGINFPTIFNATTLVDKKGETEGSFAFVTDITERKKAEEKLKTITERLELAMDAGEHGFWDWNLDTDDIYFSPRYYTMLGYKPGELPMRKETWAGLMHPEDQKIIVPKVEKHVKNAESYEVEFRLKTKDGDWKWISGRGKSYSIDKKGISHRAIGVHVDITERKQSEERLKKTMGTTIQTMSKIIEVKDPYTAGHQQRVSQLTTAIAKELNLPPDKIEGIKITSLLHDIGKISVPTEILSKTTTLSDIEFSLIKEHSQAGHDILKAIDFSYPVANIVLQHHERLNGSGYPQGLKGDEILLEARILGVADVVEAMSSHRPYRPSLGIDAALEEISKNKGILYDPEVVDACLKLFKEKGFKLE